MYVGDIARVLDIFRRVKNEHNPSITGIAFVQSYSGSPSDIVTLRVASEILETIKRAQYTILALNMSDEAKEGLIKSISSLAQAFSLNALQGQIKGQLGDLSGPISNLVIICEMANISTTSEVPSEAVDLTKDIDAAIQFFESSEGIDDVVRQTALEYLTLLRTFLSHVPVFGVDAALATLVELIKKLRTAESSASPEAKEKTKGFWKSAETWKDRIISIDSIWNTAAKLIERGSDIPHLLSHII